MDSLFDQTALIALAERLIAAAQAAGADTADAVAMRSMSQSVEVRDGAGLRALLTQHLLNKRDTIVAELKASLAQERAA